MQDYYLENKTRTRVAYVITCQDLVLGGDFTVVSVVSKTGKTLAKYEVPEHEPFKQYTTLLSFAKANNIRH